MLERLPRKENKFKGKKIIVCESKFARADHVAQLAIAGAKVIEIDDSSKLPEDLLGEWNRTKIDGAIIHTSDHRDEASILRLIQAGKTVVLLLQSPANEFLTDYYKQLADLQNKNPQTCRIVQKKGRDFMTLAVRELSSLLQ